MYHTKIVNRAYTLNSSLDFYLLFENFTAYNYCTSWNFRGGFIFANFASQTLAKISTSIYVYL